MSKISIARLIAASIVIAAAAFGAGYLAGVQQESSQAMAGISRQCTLAHLPGYARDVELLSLLASLETEEFLAKRQEMLCKVIKIKVGLVADMYKGQAEIDAVSPPKPNWEDARRVLTSYADAAKRTFNESECAQPMASEVSQGQTQIPPRSE